MGFREFRPILELSDPRVIVITYSWLLHSILESDGIPGIPWNW